MKKAKIAVATVLTSEATTTFSGAIIGIDQAQRTITFQTSTGQTSHLLTSRHSATCMVCLVGGENQNHEMN